MINFGRAFIKNTKVFRSEDKTKYIIMFDTGISKPIQPNSCLYGSYLFEYNAANNKIQVISEDKINENFTECTEKYKKIINKMFLILFDVSSNGKHLYHQGVFEILSIEDIVWFLIRHNNSSTKELIDFVDFYSKFYIQCVYE